MAVKTAAVTVATTATLLSTVPSDSVSGQSIAFYNNDATDTIYVGGSAVTTAIGVPVAALSWSPGFDLSAGEGLYGIVASGTAEARVLETGV